jgi:protein AroM
MRKVGLVTIGQSPREDIVNSMFDRSTPLRLIEHGALDELSLDEILELQPVPGELPLVSRLRDGTEVVIAKERLIPHLQRAVDRATTDGATLAVILCTGEFTRLCPSIPAIYPDRVLSHMVEAVLPSGALGVMLPHEGQMAMMREKWCSPTRRFIGTAISPYTARAELAEHARRLRDEQAAMIVMDCMGFDTEMKRTVAEASGLPTILANRLVGRVVEELTSV